MNKLTLIITPAPTGLKLPTLTKLMRKATTTSIDELPSTLPIAALTGLVYGIDTHEGYWLRADPVDLRADINSAYFFGQQALNLDLAQAQKLADSIKPLLVDLDIELFVPDPYCWFLKLKQAILLKTPHPDTMQGASIRDYLIEAEPWVRRLFTEIQMLLPSITHKKIGERPVTGLWLWGGGELCSNVDNNLLVIHPDENMEEQYLLPIYRDLRQKKISELLLYTGGDVMYSVTPKQLSWWRNLV
ncbi:MAG: hypothetical protein EXR81_02545 [Gammaproteobacteria bacterium]|nr:hypothetical protein [Gammaproteobacteria bacterium]